MQTLFLSRISLTFVFFFSRAALRAVFRFNFTFNLDYINLSISAEATERCDLLSLTCHRLKSAEPFFQPPSRTNAIANASTFTFVVV